jgi:hypothetical protein
LIACRDGPLHKRRRPHTRCPWQLTRGRRPPRRPLGLPRFGAGSALVGSSNWTLTGVDSRRRQEVYTSYGGPLRRSIVVPRALVVAESQLEAVAEEPRHVERETARAEKRGRS